MNELYVVPTVEQVRRLNRAFANSPERKAATPDHIIGALHGIRPRRIIVSPDVNLQRVVCPPNVTFEDYLRQLLVNPKVQSNLIQL